MASDFHNYSYDSHTLLSLLMKGDDHTANYVMLYYAINSKQAIAGTRNHLTATAWRSFLVNFFCFLATFLAKKISSHSALLFSWAGWFELAWVSVSTMCCRKSCGQSPHGPPKEHLSAAEAASQVLRCISRSASSRVREVRPHLGCCIWFWAPQYKGDMGKLEGAQQRATKMVGSAVLALWEETGEYGLNYPGEGKALVGG